MKIVEKLKELGWIDQMVDLVKNQNITPAVMEASLEIIFHYDPDLEDTWIADIHQMGVDHLWDLIQTEANKEKALDQVDPKALFEKATKGKSVVKEIEITDPEQIEKIKKIIEELGVVLKEVEG